MDESFYTSKHVPKEVFAGLIGRSNSPAISRFVVMCLLFFAAAIWAVLAWHSRWWNLIGSQICFGIMVCSLFACLHETAHGTAFQSRQLNRWAASLMGLLHLYPASLFRELHFTHHRHTHVPGVDPEISIGNRPAPSVLSNLPMYLSWMTGIPLLLYKVAMLVSGALGMPEPLRQNLYPFVRKSMRKSIAAESAIVLAFQLGLLWLAVYVNSGFYAIFMGQVVGHCLLAAYLAPEHNGLPHGGNVLEITRSMNTNRWVKLLMWNMPYHAEHHAFPAVPFHALPALHGRIQGELKQRTDGYTKFHVGVLRQQLKQNR